MQHRAFIITAALILPFVASPADAGDIPDPRCIWRDLDDRCVGIPGPPKFEYLTHAHVIIGVDYTGEFCGGTIKVHVSAKAPGSYSWSWSHHEDSDSGDSVGPVHQSDVVVFDIEDGESVSASASITNNVWDFDSSSMSDSFTCGETKGLPQTSH